MLHLLNQIHVHTSNCSGKKWFNENQKRRIETFNTLLEGRIKEKIGKRNKEEDEGKKKEIVLGKNAVNQVDVKTIPFSGCEHKRIFMAKELRFFGSSRVE